MANEKVIPPSWCPKHFARFQVDLIRQQAAPRILDAFMTDPRVMTFCGADFKTGQTATEEKLLSALKRFSPVCCTLGDEVMEEIFQLTAFGRPRPLDNSPLAGLIIH